MPHSLPDPVPPPREWPRRRAAGFVAVIVAVSLVVASCGSGGRAFELPPSSESQPSSTGGPDRSAAPERVQPPFTAPPVTYSLGGTADRSVLHYYNASLTLLAESAELVLGFRVQQSRRDDSELLEQNLAQWEADGIEPTPFQVDGAKGYWNETSDARRTTTGRSGLRRFYVLAKGAVTVTLSVHTDEGVELTDETRRLADELIRGVRFDESGLGVASVSTQALPVAPFTFERPAGLSGGNEFEIATVYWTRYEFGGHLVEVTVRTTPDAAARYADRLADLRATAAEVVDVTRESSTASTIGARIDEGAGLAPRHNGGIVLMYFILRKGDRYVQVRVDGERQPLPPRVRRAVMTIVTGMSFT